jgi:YVTN family beta-propeller protein
MLIFFQDLLTIKENPMKRKTWTLRVIYFLGTVVIVGAMFFSPLMQTPTRADASSNPTVIGTVNFGGQNPDGVGVDSATNLIYVANEFSNTVSVVDGSSNNVVAMVNVGVDPKGVDVNSITNRIYVGNSGSGTVSVINGSNDNVITTVNVGSNLQSIVVNPITNLIYAACSETISVINGSNNNVVANVNLGFIPVDLVVNPVTNRIYVLSSNTVSVIDGSSNNIVATVTLKTGFAEGLAVNSDTNLIYITENNYHTGFIYVINGSNNTVVATVPIPVGPCDPQNVVVNPVTNIIYVSYNNGYVCVINGSSGYLITSMGLTNNILALGMNTNTNRIIVAASDDTLSVINGFTNCLIFTIRLGDNLNDVAVNPTTNLIYVSNQYSDTVLVVDGSSNKLVASVNVTGSPSCIAVNPITNLIYVGYGSPGNFGVSVISGSGDLVIATIHLGGSTPPNCIAVNPITNKIYVADNGNLDVIDGSSNSEIAWVNGPNCDGGVESVDVNPITNRIYVASAYGTVSVIDGTSNNLIVTVNMGTYTLGVAVDSVTNQIYVVNQNENGVFVIDGASNIVVGEATAFAYAVAVNPITDQIYAVSPGGLVGTVSVINGSSNGVLATINVGNIPIALAVNPATHRIYVANQGSDSLSIIQDSPAPAIALTSSATPSTNGQSITFTASINPSTATGTVQFTIDGSNFGNPVTIANGIATSVSVSTLSVSNHIITAEYSGDANFLPSTGTLTQIVANSILTLSGDDDVAGIVQAAEGDFYNDTGIAIVINTESDSQAIQDLQNGNCDIAGVGSDSR